MCPPRKERTSNQPGTDDPIAKRIRELRLAAGLSLAQLAARSGLSAPSHILHIENGSKCPSEEVAVRLAEALADDTDLYRDWARARGRSQLVPALAAAERLRRRLSELGLGRGEAGPATAPAQAATRAPSTDAPAPGAMMRVPVIADGQDPGDGILPQARVLRSLRLDPQLLPPLEQLRRPFAYATDPAAGPVRHAVISRQFEILLDRTRGVAAATAGPRFAIRTRGGVILAHARWDGATLHRADEGEPPSYPADANRLREIVVGTVVLEIRGG